MMKHRKAITITAAIAIIAMAATGALSMVSF